MIKYLLLLILTSVLLSAHSGRTDANGGHWETATGTYHYHADPIPHQQANKDLEIKLKRQNDALPLVKKG
jgi:hypothetical protein